MPPASHQPLLQNHLLYASEFQSWFDRLACPEYNRVGVRSASRAPCHTRIPLGVTASRLGSTASNFQNRCLVDKATQCCLEETKKKKKNQKKESKKEKEGKWHAEFPSARSWLSPAAVAENARKVKGCINATANQPQPKLKLDFHGSSIALFFVQEREFRQYGGSRASISNSNQWITSNID